MDPTLIGILTVAGSVLGGTAAGAWATGWFNRTKIASEADKLAAEADKLAAEAHRAVIDNLRDHVTHLLREVVELRLAQLGFQANDLSMQREIRALKAQVETDQQVALRLEIAHGEELARRDVTTASLTAKVAQLEEENEGLLARVAGLEIKNGSAP